MRVLHVTTTPKKGQGGSLSFVLSEDDETAIRQLRTWAELAPNATWEVRVQEALRQDAPVEESAA